MSRDELVDKFDECFGISTATEAQRKKFFDWVMDQQQAAQQSVERTLVDIGDGCMVDPLILAAILPE